MSDIDWAADSPLDTIAAQARSYPPLPDDRVAELLGRVHDGRGAEGATAELVRHHLSIPLDAALARRDQGLDVGDLYQEGSIAVVTAVDEYARRGGEPAGLREYVRRVVDLHLDAAVEREAEEKRAGEAFVRDAQSYELVEVELRHRLGRHPTPTELAAALEWSVEHVETVAEMLAEARALNDESLLPYLDDAASVEDDEEEE
jgi:DNA-directed RNA polymerase sigma subunit (sigma70/sigma32)